MINPFKKVFLGIALRTFRSLDKDSQKIIMEDLSGNSPDAGKRSLEKQLSDSKSFRSIMLYRIRQSGNRRAINAYKIFLLAYPEAHGIEIDGEIAGGLRIVHHCCVISVAHAGKNLSVGPFVVIGKKGGAAPVIGDNVTICANSTVMGGIHIGDNALIGAGSLVYHDVPAGAVVGGNPARILKYCDGITEIS